MKKCNCGAVITIFSVRCPPCAEERNRERARERIKRIRLARKEEQNRIIIPTDGIPWPVTKGFTIRY